MEFGILILIILGSFIFKSSKSSSTETTKPIPSKDMTWEEMEAYYGITLSRDQQEPIEVVVDSHTDEHLEVMSVTYDPVGLDRQARSVEASKSDTLVDRESLRLAARRGMVWSIILEAPKGLMRRYGR